MNEILCPLEVTGPLSIKRCGFQGTNRINKSLININDSKTTEEPVKKMLSNWLKTLTLWGYRKVLLRAKAEKRKS